MAEKELGNAAYKKKDFDEALIHYDRAIELDPSDITFLTNKAGVWVWHGCGYYNAWLESHFTENSLIKSPRGSVFPKLLLCVHSQSTCRSLI